MLWRGISRQDSSPYPRSAAVERKRFVFLSFLSIYAFPCYIKLFALYNILSSIILQRFPTSRQIFFFRQGTTISSPQQRISTNFHKKPPLKIMLSFDVIVGQKQVNMAFFKDLCFIRFCDEINFETYRYTSGSRIQMRISNNGEIMMYWYGT